MRSNILSLLGGQAATVIPSIPRSGEPFRATISIKPVTPNAKAGYETEVEAATYGELMQKLGEAMNGIEEGALKPLKAGYIAKVTYPTSDSDPDVTTSRTAYNVRDSNDMNSRVAEDIAYNKEGAEKASKALDELRDEPKAQTTKGAKGVALLEAMAKFRFFSGSYADHELSAAYDTVVDRGTMEYTNRGEGIRIHPQYDGNGELRKARFSLDSPDSSFNTFSQEQVDRTNKELEDYFASVDAANKPAKK